MIDVLVLSILQGVAEFLPISSSGHLVLGRELLGLGDVGLRLDIFLHVGTLLAVFVFYSAIVLRLMKGLFSPLITEKVIAWTYAAKIVISAIPVWLVGIFFKDQIESAFAEPRRVGFALLVTGVVLLVTRFMPKGDRGVSFSRALWMGLAQAVAILPGISRSGMTLVAARAAKVDGEKAAEFSFLMSAPPIVGAALLEVVKAIKMSKAETFLRADVLQQEVSWGLCFVGAAVAAVVGYFALKLLLAALKSDRFWLFGPYCLVAGLVTILVA